MDIKKVGSRPSKAAPEAYFTGTVRMDPVMDAPEPARTNSVVVTFEPSARTAWHTHPYGQTLFVLSGCGRAQSWGEEIRDIKPGDTLWFEPGEKHWHGASPNVAMSHIAIQEKQDGSAADWLEYVSDEQYGA
jgi:quercetin dioxygenase-like cupin family protein